MPTYVVHVVLASESFGHHLGLLKQRKVSLSIPKFTTNITKGLSLAMRLERCTRLPCDSQAAKLQLLDGNE